MSLGCVTSCELDGMARTKRRERLCAPKSRKQQCVIIAKGTLTLEFPDFRELLSLSMACFQPPRIFQPQSEPPEEECQTVFQIFCLTQSWSALSVDWLFFKPRLGDELSAAGQGWGCSLSRGNLDQSDVTKGQGC